MPLVSVECQVRDILSRAGSAGSARRSAGCPKRHGRAYMPNVSWIEMAATSINAATTPASEINQRYFETRRINEAALAAIHDEHRKANHRCPGHADQPE
ncbi:MAG: hypothetical protein EOO38_12135 [Cytophagaceae bacterium]|nr:MAG: hypothetical protein EOO38_12135 [Cytophagaceae bacterium]